MIQNNRDIDTLKDILGSMRMIETYLSQLDLNCFESSTLHQDALIRRLEIIGEATARLSETFKEAYPDIPWKQMKGMRNILIHTYDSVDLDFVWEASQLSVNRLIPKLESILGLK
jgi:uncharacterized protein with HEPN domain